VGEEGKPLPMEVSFIFADGAPLEKSGCNT
jgi:hypothetical protein